MAVGKYHVMTPDDGASSSSSSSSQFQQQQLPDSHRISLRVTSPYGNSLHYAENVHSGNFAFTASEAGDYLACFWAPDHRPPATVAPAVALRLPPRERERARPALEPVVPSSP